MLRFVVLHASSSSCYHTGSVPTNVWHYCLQVVANMSIKHGEVFPLQPIDMVHLYCLFVIYLFMLLFDRMATLDHVSPRW